MFRLTAALFILTAITSGPAVTWMTEGLCPAVTSGLANSVSDNIDSDILWGVYGPFCPP